MCIIMETATEEALKPKLSWYRRKCMEDPDFAKNYKETNRAYYLARLERDPEGFRAARSADWRRRYQTSEVFRQKNVESSRRYRARIKSEKVAAQSALLKEPASQ